MYFFSYWHAYYDSLFLKSNIIPSRFLLEQLQITSATCIRWSAFQDLPQLASMFEALQRFIMHTAAWHSCFCEEKELQMIEEKLNNLMVLLHCQKIYGKEYWEHDKRRVQASFVHFFIIFKQYILAILPRNIQNVLQACNKAQLPTNLVELQKLVNTILKLFKPVYTYLFSTYFQEERQLTQQLFDSFSIFLQKLPHSKKGQIAQVPKIMKFICICNTFQAHNNSIKQFKQIRSKSGSFQPKVRCDSPSSKHKKNNSKSDILVNSEFIKQSSLSSRNHSNKKPEEGNDSKQEKYIFFKFNKNIKNNSLSTQKRSLTIAFQPKINKKLTINKILRERSVTIKPKFTGMTKRIPFGSNGSNIHRQTLRKKSTISYQVKMSDNTNQEQEIQRANKLVKCRINQIFLNFIPGNWQIKRMGINPIIHFQPDCSKKIEETIK